MQEAQERPQPTRPSHGSRSSIPCGVELGQAKGGRAGFAPDLRRPFLPALLGPGAGSMILCGRFVDDTNDVMLV